MAISSWNEKRHLMAIALWSIIICILSAFPSRSSVAMLAQGDWRISPCVAVTLGRMTYNWLALGPAIRAWSLDNPCTRFSHKTRVTCGRRPQAQHCDLRECRVKHTECRVRRWVLVPSRRCSPSTCFGKFPRRRSATHVGVVMRDPSEVVADVLVAKL